MPYQNEFLSLRHKEENSLLIHNTLKKMKLFEEQEQVLWKMLLRYEIQLEKKTQTNFMKADAEKFIPTTQCSRKSITCISNFGPTCTYYSYL